MASDDFELGLVVDSDDAVWVRVLDSPAGTTGPRRVSESLSTLREASRELLASGIGRARNMVSDGPSQPRVSTPDSAELLGELLFRAMFPDNLRSLFDECRGLAGSTDGRLPIRLRFDLADSRQRTLAAVPWEMTRIPGTEKLLGLDRRHPVVRQPEILGSSQVPPPPYPIRITVLTSSPAGVPELNLSAELRDLEEEWSDRSEVSIRVDKAKVGRLRAAALSDSHVIHFMGHGSLDRDRGGLLLLEDRHGQVSEKPASVIARVLDCAEALRLVVLNACSTAEMPAGATTDGFQTLAPALVRAGIPAVVAMLAPISDSSALVFSRALYRSLASGDPVDVAVTEGRLAIYSDCDVDYEWAVPTLYLSRAQTQLFLARDEARVQGEARRYFDRGRAAVDGGDPQLAYGHFLRAYEIQEGEYPDAELHACLARMAERPLSSLPPTLADDLDRRLYRLMQADDSELATLALRASALLRIDYYETKHLRPVGCPTSDLARALTATSTPTDTTRQLLLSIRATDRARRHAGLTRSR